jgi:hypothetical protein
LQQKPLINLLLPRFFLNLIIIKIILLIIRMIKAKFKIYEWQCATDSGAEQTRHWRQILARVFYSDQKPVFRQMCHCQWRVYTKTPLTVARFSKDVTDSGAFTQKRH